MKESVAHCTLTSAALFTEQCPSNLSTLTTRIYDALMGVTATIDQIFASHVSILEISDFVSIFVGQFLPPKAQTTRRLSPLTVSIHSLSTSSVITVNDGKKWLGVKL
jgi:hypothetical protein